MPNGHSLPSVLECSLGGYAMSIMDITLCNISAFNYYRIPPPVLSLLPMVTIDESNVHHSDLTSNLTLTDAIGFPLNILVPNAKHRTNAKCFKHRVCSADLPFGSIRETEHDFKVTSPEMTLLSLASTVTTERLALAIYEMCGSFAIFNPSDTIEELLAPYRQELAKGVDGWKRIAGDDGTPSNLWSRAPLVELHELGKFIESTRGIRGNKRLASAFHMVSGVTASPFEAQLSLLLFLPRSSGGEGLSISNNHEVMLSADARKLCKNKRAYIDIYLTSEDGEHDLALECQGRISHGVGGVKDSDADRATALSTMGYEIVFITYQQISSQQQFDVLRRLIFEKISMEFRDKTPTEKEAELDLRRNIFVDWETIGTQERWRCDRGRQKRR